MTVHETTRRPPAPPAGAAVRALLVAGEEAESAAAAPLSHAARRVRDVLGVASGVWKVLGSTADGHEFECLSRHDPPAFPALWARGEVPEIGRAGLARRTSMIETRGRLGPAAGPGPWKRT